MKEINILCVFHSNILAKSGTPHRTRNIVTTIAKQPNINVSLASTDDELNIDSIRHIHIERGSLRENTSKISGYIKKNNIDIVISHTMSGFKLLSLLKIKNRIKIITESHAFREEDGYFLQKISWMKYIRNKILYSMYYFLNDGIITVSKNAEDYVSHFTSNTLTVFGAVNTSIFNPDIKSLNLGFKKNTVIIGYAGNTRKYQGVQTVVDHFEKFTENHPHFRLALLLSDRENHSLDISSNKIKLFGPVEYEDVPKFLNASDILIVPRLINRSTKYSFPSKLFDCMAMKKPVIASATRDISEVIQDGQNGFLYDMSSYKSFYGCCERAMKPEIRKRVSENAAEEAINRYSWEHQGKRIVDFMESILNK